MESAIEVQPKRLVHSGSKRAYPSKYVWDCTICNHWNIWQTSITHGKKEVFCQECGRKHLLDKSNPKEIITRTKKDKGSIID